MMADALPPEVPCYHPVTIKARSATNRLVQNYGGSERGDGATAYRFSIAWPRTFPDGIGPNAKGVDFYSRLVDERLAAGIEPLPTLHHRYLPQALQDRYGGWQSAETAKAFGDYAGYIAGPPSDRVRTSSRSTSSTAPGHRPGRSYGSIRHEGCGAPARRPAPQHRLPDRVVGGHPRAVGPAEG